MVLLDSCNFKAVITAAGMITFVPESAAAHLSCQVRCIVLSLKPHPSIVSCDQGLSTSPARVLELAEMQAYYHGSISREEAENRLAQQGSPEGMYLLRIKDAAKCTFALSVCHRFAVEHHLIQVSVCVFMFVYVCLYVCRCA